MKEKLYRFMLAFDSEPQDVGLFQGIDETGMDISLMCELTDPFEELPCPMLETPDDSPVEFWFREKGLDKFKDDLNNIINELSNLNWQVLGQEMTETLENSLYFDEYQVAFSASCLETDKSRYAKVSQI